MTLENFFDGFETIKEHFNNLFNLEISLKSKMGSSVRYTVMGDYTFKGVTHDLNGHFLIDDSNNVLGRLTEQYMNSGYNLITGMLVAEKVPGLRLVKAPSSSKFGDSTFDIIYLVLHKSDNNSSLEGAYKGGCGLSKSSGNANLNIVNLVMKRSARVQL